MKRLLGMLITLFSIYFIFQFVFLYFGGGHVIEYEVKINGKNAKVVETLTQNKKDEVDNYYINVEVDNLKFDFQIFEKYYGRTRVLEDLYYFSDNIHACLFPVFSGADILKDMKCYEFETGYYYNYDQIKNNNTDLLSFVDSLSSYDEAKFIDDLSEPIREDRIVVYQNNILDNHYVGLSSYRGLYTINNNNLNKIVEVPLFGSDVYTRRLNVTVDNYYLVANYDSRNSFKEIITIDLSNNRKDSIPIRNDLSFDSYFQGVREGRAYLFDKEDSTQYRVNPNNSSVVEVGGVSNGLLMYNGKDLTDRIDAFEAIKEEVKFNNFTHTNEEGFDYQLVSKYNETGYQYFIKKEQNEYLIYRASTQDISMKKYILKTQNLETTIFLNDFIYYVSGDELLYYSDATGKRVLVKNSELEFNKNIYFGVYIR